MSEIELEMEGEVNVKGEKRMEGKDGRRELLELEQTLDKVQIELSIAHLSEQRPKIEPSECPDSYSENSAVEKLLLSMAENLHAQYSYLYPDRKQLLLFPLNEFGVQKFVSTTLRPTLVPFDELYDWQGCASFVTDFLTLELLDCPSELPKQLCSPTWVVQSRKGTCFEFSTLLCSLLLGAGYNAYCVSGYAVKEMCLLDLTCQDCPLRQPQETVKEKSSQQEEIKKYMVQPAEELKSTFEQCQEKKKQEKQNAFLIKQQEAKRIKEEQQRLLDPLWRSWIHSWVLVLAGKRAISENFFIDSLSGQSYPTSSGCFLGIESIWNHENYWINMQDCGFNCKEMTYELHDVLKWEYMLSGTSQLDSHDGKGGDKDEQKDDMAEELKAFVMPHSWVAQIHISEEDVESRFPGGSKVIHYKKATLEKFSPYLLKDGLIRRLTTFDDLERTKVNTVKEWYENRCDELHERELKKATNVTIECFLSGRKNGLKTHRYVTLVPDTDRLMEFYRKARDDNLVSRLETPTEMIETFQDRSDFLYYRHVIYKPSGLAQTRALRPIQKVVVKFHRDRTKPANKDVAELVLLILQNQIEVTYHPGDDRIIPNFHIFKKPNNYDDDFSDKMVSSFQVEPNAEPFTKLYLYQTLIALMQEEEKILLRIKDSESDVRNILDVRDGEENGIRFKISSYDVVRNEKARLYMEKLNQLTQEKEVKKRCEVVDILAPFLAQLGEPQCLTKQQAVQIYTNCLDSLKQRLIDKANLIQAQFEKETQELLQKQQWYQENQFNLTKQEEAEYLAYCSEAMFRIKIIQLRLSRNKEKAPQKYLALDKTLKQHSRLMQHLDRELV